MQSITKKFWLTPLALVVVIVLLHFFSLQAGWVEKIYSGRIYIFLSPVLRLLTRWIPFSIGDVVYILIFIWFVAGLIRFFRKGAGWRKFFFLLRGFVVKCLWVYIIFFLLWGLNYYRYGIGYKLKLVPEMYSTEDLTTVTNLVRDRLNANRRLMDSLHIGYADNETTFNEAINMYRSAKTVYPYLGYSQPDVKKMLFGIAANYSGFLGYYNPFTGEAQVNTKVPAFLIPFTACHEIGHQLGFASESEASFVGYLATQTGNSPVFNYSAYFDLFGFANGELYSRDSIAAQQNMRLLDTLVKKDYAEYRQYLRDYQSPLSPLLSKLYGDYLKAHNQPKGIESYDEVVAWIIAYYKKYGKI